MVRYAINGLGRIGRALLRIAARRPELELVAVNDVAPASRLAPLVARDTLHGPYPGDVSVDGDRLLLDGRPVACFEEPEPEHIPWGEAGTEVVVEATGRCRSRSRAARHLRQTVRKVVVSANAPDLDLTLCLGVNDASYEPDRHHLVSAASCTTNCLAPVVHVLHQSFGLAAAMLNTVHSYNNDQRLLEYPHHDPRRARAAALNMIPTTTSAVAAVALVLPELAGRIEGFAVRVPTPDVSLIDLVAELESGPSVPEVRDAFRRAAAAELEGILGVAEEELVSSDFLRDPRSAVVDLPLTASVGSRLFRVVAWYDNEWGHAARLADLVELVGAGAPPQEGSETG